MSAASLLAVYNGTDPELAFPTGSAGTASLAATLAVGNSAGTYDINMNGKSVLDALDVVATGDVSVGGAVKGTAAATFVVEGAAGHGVSVQGPVGASLVATTGGAAVTSTAGAITLTAGAAAPGGLVLAGAGLPATARTADAWTATANTGHYLAITIGNTPYYIPLSAATW